MKNIILITTVWMMITVLTHVMASNKTVQPQSPAAAMEDAAIANETFVFRLPTSLKPRHYYIRLQPFINGNYSIHGYTEITFVVENATSVITLHITDIVTHNETVKVVSAANKTINIPVKNQTYEQNVDFYRVFLHKDLVKGEEYILSLDFVGVLNKKLKGFYPSSYQDEHGKQKLLAATQFQISDGRKAFPCFDEPSFKASFTVDLIREANMSSLSNMPKTESTPLPGQNGWLKDSFQTSVPMSTYLVAFMVSDFKNVTSPIVDDVLFRVWSRKSALSQLDYALNAGHEMLLFFEEYLNVSYSLPKLDMVALPDFSFGAMENWGLVNYREDLLVYDPKRSSAQNKWRTGHIIAHELAHQWFGNLMTPDWWSNIWLSEGFANFMETIGLEAVEPSYRAYEECIIRSSRAAFESDSTNAHPLSFPTPHPSVLNDIISGVVYHKAGALLRMLMYVLSEETFKKGLVRFFDKFSFSSAASEDFWRAQHEQSLADSSAPSEVNVLDMMHNWTYLNGYPVVNVKLLDNGTAILTQQRFVLTPNDKNATNIHKWWIPITYTTQTISNFTDTRTKLWLNPSKENAVITGLPSDGSWVIFNIYQSGYYRVNYDDINWANIVKQFRQNHSIISPVNRAQIIGDAFQLARAGLLSYSVALDLVRYIKNETDLVPLKAAFAELKYVEKLLQRTESMSYFTSYANPWIESLFNYIGFSDDLSSPNREQRKRSLILKESCKANHKPCLENSLQLFQTWMLDPTNESIISPNLDETVWCSAIKEGGPIEWQFLWDRFLSSNVGSEKKRLMKAMACSNNDTTRIFYLEKAFTTGSEIRSQDASLVFRYLSSTLEGANTCWTYFKNNFHHVYDYIGYERTIGSMIRSATQFFNSAKDLAELQNIIAKNPELRTPGMKSTERVVEEITGRVQWMKERYKLILQYLVAQNTPA